MTKARRRSAPREVRYYPMFVNLTDRPVVLVGGGEVASRKAEALLAAGADLTVISPELCPSMQSMPQAGEFHYIPRPYQKGDLEGAWLAVAATDDVGCQEMVFQEAQERRIFCNVVDRPQLCSFIVPSQVRRGPLTIAISTSGCSPALARSIRKELSQRFSQAYGPYVELLGRVRERIIETEPDPQRRKELCLSLADPQVLDWIEREEWGKVADWLQRFGINDMPLPVE